MILNKVKHKKALLVFFNGKSNAGGAERMVQYLEEYLISRGIRTEIIDEHVLMQTIVGQLYNRMAGYSHFKKRKSIYLARIASLYLWARKRRSQIVISNGESTPFYPVDIVVCQGCYHAMEIAYGRPRNKLSRMAKLQLRGLTIARHIITVTDQVKQDLIKIYKMRGDNIFIVSNRVDTNFFFPLPKTSKSFRTVLYVGRLEPGKGLDAICRLAKIIEQESEWRFLIACNNQYNTELFVGFKNTRIKIGLQLENINAEAYGEADIVLFPSLYESFGMVTIEALAAGVPVIASPVGIIPELANRKFPGVHVLPPFQDGKILTTFNNIINEFQLIDKTELHDMIAEEFGISSYRKRLDKFFLPGKQKREENE